ncbi:MAG TPA: hypothetical protein VN915_06870 [Elusimicrobiota bacterium]|nr:hypothetical protein [Elusimicrobiota bacterium]
MPHDKNGIEIKPGDVVRVPPESYMPHEKIGAVRSVNKGSDLCNLSVEVIGKQAQTEHFESLPAVQLITVSAKDCEKLA